MVLHTDGCFKERSETQAGYLTDHWSSWRHPSSLSCISGSMTRRRLPHEENTPVAVDVEMWPMLASSSKLMAGFKGLMRRFEGIQKQTRENSRRPASQNMMTKTDTWWILGNKELMMMMRDVEGCSRWTWLNAGGHGVSRSLMFHHVKFD